MEFHLFKMIDAALISARKRPQMQKKFVHDDYKRMVNAFGEELDEITLKNDFKIDVGRALFKDT